MGVKQPKETVVKARPDPMLPCGQEYMVFSYLSPKGATQRSNQTWIKVSGAFETAQEADAWAKALRQKVPDFDIFIARMGVWLPVRMPLELQWEIPMTYMENEFNQIMKGYYKELEQGNQQIQKRIEEAKERNRCVAKRTGKIMDSKRAYCVVSTRTNANRPKKPWIAGGK